MICDGRPAMGALGRKSRLSSWLAMLWSTSAFGRRMNGTRFALNRFAEFLCFGRSGDSVFSLAAIWIWRASGEYCPRIIARWMGKRIAGQRARPSATAASPSPSARAGPQFCVARLQRQAPPSKQALLFLTADGDSLGFAGDRGAGRAKGAERRWRTGQSPCAGKSIQAGGIETG